MKQELFELIDELNREMGILLAVIKGAQYDIRDGLNLDASQPVESALADQYWRCKDVYEKIKKRV